MVHGEVFPLTQKVISFSFKLRFSKEIGDKQLDGCTPLYKTEFVRK